MTHSCGSLVLQVRQREAGISTRDWPACLYKGIPSARSPETSELAEREGAWGLSPIGPARARQPLTMAPLVPYLEGSRLTDRARKDAATWRFLDGKRLTGDARLVDERTPRDDRAIYRDPATRINEHGVSGGKLVGIILRGPSSATHRNGAREELQQVTNRPPPAEDGHTLEGLADQHE